MSCCFSSRDQGTGASYQVIYPAGAYGTNRLELVV